MFEMTWETTIDDYDQYEYIELPFFETSAADTIVFCLEAVACFSRHTAKQLQNQNQKQNILRKWRFYC